MPSLASTTAGLGGTEQRGLAGVRVMMDEHRMVALSGVMVASTTARPGRVDASVLKMDRWQIAATASESAPDRCVPKTGIVAWLGPPILDVRLCCEVHFGIRLGLSAPLHHLDRSSDNCCQVGGFRLTDVLYCKVFV
jgi:hypothetical protein